MRIALLLAWMFMLFMTQAHAQNNQNEALSTAGGEAAGSGGSSSYTVGQVFYNSNQGGTFSVSEGVQQAFEISVITGIDDLLDIDLTISVFPNPTMDKLILEIANYNNESLDYQLFDYSGILLQNREITSKNNTVDMSLLSAASYILSVSSDNQLIKSFKIIKTQ